MKSLGFMFAFSLALTSLAAGVLAPFIIKLLAATSESSGRQRGHDQLAEFALANPIWLPAFALPGVVFGIIILVRRRFRPILFLFGLASLLALIGALFAAFFAVVAPLYHQQPL